MSDNYLETGKQMFQDGKTLHGQSAHRNACYLFGYVAECYFKLLITAVDETPRRIHALSNLDADLAARISANNNISSYMDPNFHSSMKAVVVPGRVDECHWDPKHRYDGSRWTEPSCQNYLQEAGFCHEQILKMELDGVIS